MEEKKTYESKKDVMGTGKFFEAYTDKTFLAVYQAFGIDKVKFSFAYIGSGGKGCDIYVDTDDFDILCDDILSDKLKDKFINSKKNDKGYYDTVWEYKTGEKATKQIIIQRGLKKPIAIQGVDVKKKERIPVTLESYNEFRKMAKWWKRISSPYYNQLAKVGYEAKNAFRPDSNIGS